MPALEEAPAAATQEPFGTNFGDFMSQTLGSELAKARAESEHPAETQNNDRQERQQVERQVEQAREETSENQREQENRREDQQVSAQAETTDKDKDKPDEEIDGRNGKQKIRWSKMSPAERDLLTASEARQVERQRELTEKNEALEKRDKEREAELVELRQKAGERDELDGKYKKLDESYREQQKHIASVDIRKTDEYRQSVLQPWEENVEKAYDELSKMTGVDKDLLYAAAARGDRAMLSRAINALPEELENGWSREDVRQEAGIIFNTARQLIAKDQEYDKRGADALKEINDRKSASEKQASESHRAEVERNRASVSAQNAKFFEVLDPANKNLSDGQRKFLSDMEDEMKKFDFSSLTPDRQAQFIEAAHKGWFAANFEKGKAAWAMDQLTAKEKELAEANAKIKDFEKRLSNRENTTLTPGRSGGDSRDNAPVEHKGDAASLAGNLIKQAQSGR